MCEYIALHFYGFCETSKRGLGREVFFIGINMYLRGIKRGGVRLSV